MTLTRILHLLNTDVTEEIAEDLKEISQFTERFNNFSLVKNDDDDDDDDDDGDDKVEAYTARSGLYR